MDPHCGVDLFQVLEGSLMRDKGCPCVQIGYVQGGEREISLCYMVPILFISFNAISSTFMQQFQEHEKGGLYHSVNKLYVRNNWIS